MAQTRTATIVISDAAPTVNDDIGKGYQKGQHWVYNDQIWICRDDAIGVADWVELVASTPTDAHKTLRHLVHFINEGPGDGFSTAPYREQSPNPFPTSIIWYESSAKTNKIFEIAITRNAQQRPTAVVYTMYDTDGSTVLNTATDTINYSGSFETDRTRTYT